MKRTYLVKYTNVCGEFEFSGVTVLSLEPRQQIKAAVHSYFQDYYGKKNLELDERCVSYLYNGGQVSVKSISWHPLSESDAEVLRAHNI
jgi:hypothetical protein